MLVEYFAAAGRADEVWCPDLPHRPAQAIALLEARLPGLIDGRLFGSVARAAGATGIMGAAVGLVSSVIIGGQVSLVARFLSLGTTAALGGFVYVGASYALKSDETTATWRALANLLRKI